MNSKTVWKWPALAAVGLILSAGTLVVYNTSPLGCWKPQSHSETPVLTSPSGESPMPLARQKQPIEHANDATFSSTVLKSEMPVLVDFYADWCGPCRSLAPVLEELVAETPHARIVKVNVDDSPNLAAEYGIDSIPSLKLFKNGAVAGELVGLVSKGQLRAMLSR